MTSMSPETPSYRQIDTLRWPAMPDPNHKAPGAQGVWIWPRAHVRAFEQLSPVNAHGDGYLLFPYALSYSIA